MLCVRYRIAEASNWKRCPVIFSLTQEKRFKEKQKRRKGKRHTNSYKSVLVEHFHKLPIGSFASHFCVYSMFKLLLSTAHAYKNTHARSSWMQSFERRRSELLEIYVYTILRSLPSLVLVEESHAYNQRALHTHRQTVVGTRRLCRCSGKRTPPVSRLYSVFKH